MWKLVKIEENNYFFLCEIENELVKYFLYDLNKVWNETCTLTDVFNRAKDFNKRIGYDHQTIQETIQSQEPEEIQFGASEDDVYKLRLKYSVLRHPFNFEWNLKIIPIDEFRKIITFPLYMSVNIMLSQINELREIIRKKDIEIEQYKLEGATLRRSTVATQPFDDARFYEIYKEANTVTKNFYAISEKINFYWTDISKSIEEKRSSKTTVAVHPSEPEAGASSKLKRSPQSNKRRFFQKRRNQMQKVQLAKKRQLEYECSESQTPPIDELADIQKCLKELEDMRKADLQKSEELALSTAS